MGEFRGKNIKPDSVHESPKVMLVPLVFLAILSALGAIPFILHYPDANSFASFLDPVFNASEKVLINVSPLTAGTNFMLITITLILILTSIYISFILFVRRRYLPPPESAQRKGFIRLASNKFYLDELYDNLIIKPLHIFSSFLKDIIDTKFFDNFVESTGKFVMYAGSRIRLLQTGNVGFYLFAMVICIILVLVFNLLNK